MRGKIIASINNKGGVGKTTMTVNLAHALANKKRKVLVVDSDSQSNATSLLLRPDLITDSLYELLQGDIDDPGRAIYPTSYTNLSCLPNVEETAALEFDLSKDLPQNYYLLKNKLREYVNENFDYTIIDCPPNLGFFVLNSLYAADFGIVPTLCGSAFSLEGLVKAIKFIDEIQETGNPNLKFLRLLVNVVDKRTAMSKIIIDQLEKNFGPDRMFSTKIGISTQFEQAEYLRKTILRYAPRSSGASSYRALAKEVALILDDNLEQ